MQAIINYNNTLCELNSAKTRLTLLMDRKEALYCKYFPMNKPMNSEHVDGGHTIKDPMTLYVEELNRINEETGKSLDQEITEQINEVHKLEYYIRLMDNTIKELKGLDAELYRYIVFDGMNISKAVEKISEKYDNGLSTAWRIYRKNLKKELIKLKKFKNDSEMTVKSMK